MLSVNYCKSRVFFLLGENVHVISRDGPRGASTICGSLCTGGKA